MIFVVFTFSEFLGIFVTKFSVRQAFRYTLLTETQPGVVSDHCYNSTYLDVILIKSNVHYHTWVLIPAPRLGVLSFFVVDSVCMYVRLSVTLFLQIDSSFLFLGGIKPFFWPSSLHVALYKTLFFGFCFRSPNAQNLLPKICNCTKSPITRLVWHIDRRCLHLPGGFRGWPIQWNHAKCCGPTLVAMATKFGLGTEIQLPIPAC